MDENKETVRCPNCGSTNIHFVANTKGGGYNCLKGGLGFLLCAPLALCGFNKTKTQNIRKCMACGKEF